MNKIAQTYFGILVIIFLCQISIILFYRCAISADLSSWVELIKERKKPDLSDWRKIIKEKRQTDQSEIRKLIKALERNDDETVRYNAIKSLGNMGPIAIDAVPSLIHALKRDISDDVRLEAAQALGKIGSATEEVVLALMNALETDTYAAVRASSAKVLGEIGPAAKEAVPALTKAIGDFDENVKRSAFFALGSIPQTEKEFTSGLLNWLNTGQYDSNDMNQVRNLIYLYSQGGGKKWVVPALTRKLENRDGRVRKLAAEALGKIGPEAKQAIPPLIKILKNDRDGFVRASALDALGKIGIAHKDAVPMLIRSLKREPNLDVRRRIAEYLEKLALDVSTDKSKNMIGDLKSIKEVLETNGYKKEAATVSLSIEKLENFKPILRIVWEQWFAKYPKISIFCSLYLLWGMFCLITFWFRPLYLMPINAALRKREFRHKWLAGIAIPLNYFLLIGFLNDRPRVLDAWVKLNITAVRDNFVKKETVRERKIHINVPVEMDREFIAELRPRHLRPVFKSPPACLLIWGEGGSGKTSFACKIGRWAMSEAPEDQFCKHLMIPILIEHELNSETEHPFTRAIKRQLQILTNQAEPVSDDMLERLLRQQRVLVIVDHLSEMSKLTRNHIKFGASDFSANAIIVTSRIKEKEKLGDLNKNTIKPLRVQGNQLSNFMDAYLRQRQKRNLFNDSEFFNNCAHLSTIVGDREVTILLAKLYAEQMISTKERLSFQKMPDNIPDLMIEYVNNLNQCILDNRIEDYIVHRDAKVLAWECIRQFLKPGDVKLVRAKEALTNFGLTDGEAKSHLDYLEKRLRLIQLVLPTKDRYRFIHDPLSEYLAGLYLVEQYELNNEKNDYWHKFLKDADNKEGLPVEKKGFFLALRDCCYAKKIKLKIPDFIRDQLLKG